MADITTTDLLEAGVHFGHQTKRWNPKMKRFIIGKRNGIHIIDLFQTVDCLSNVYEFVKKTSKNGGQILFVGTKRQAQNSIAAQATRVGQPYISERWLGGMLTNFSTITKRLERLKELEGINYDDVSKSIHTKKELLLLRREKDKLAKVLTGIKGMRKTPTAIFIIDTNKEHLAVNEAHKLGIPVIAIADTNCNPDEIDMPIPGNDDAIRSIDLITKAIADAVAAGVIERSNSEVAETEALSDWERELLETT
ncbi:MAG: 30S ribosomal protein S2 [Candidatus Ancillula sp.]|jgi:small subunit ribosomal protein S2|nr:30S ribosomal protein S2 [Candidatus Ancillula sp.]